MSSSSLTTHNSAARPPEPLRQALELALARAANALDGGGPLPADILARDERSALMARRVTVNAALAPASLGKIASTLATLGNMARRGQPSREMETALAKQDIADLADLPEWALSAACKAYRLAEIGTGEWRPTAGQLRTEAVKRMDWLVRERAKLARVLDAKVIEEAPAQATPDQRKRISEGLRALAAKMALGVALLCALRPSTASAHDFWSNGEPVPAWVKSSCCGTSDAHHIAASALHIVAGGYRIDGLEVVIPFDKALPSVDGEIWGFWSPYSEPSPPIYCLFVPDRGA